MAVPFTEGAESTEMGAARAQGACTARSLATPKNLVAATDTPSGPASAVDRGPVVVGRADGELQGGAVERRPRGPRRLLRPAVRGSLRDHPPLTRLAGPGKEIPSGARP